MTITAEPLATVLAPPSDRRRSPRHKPAHPIAVVIGRGAGAVIDISATGARIRHNGAVRGGAQVRITFDWKGDRFETVAVVLSSRVAGVGMGGTLFESRVTFLTLTESSTALLDRALADLGDGDLRKWVANLHGWTEEGPAPPLGLPGAVRTFVRCRLVNQRWEQRITRDSSVPADGFTVAGGTEPSEIRALCRTFEQSDAEGRRLLQLMTGAVLEQLAG